MLRTLVAATCALVLAAACGGSGKRENAAASAAFSYGPAAAATAAQAASMESSVSGAAAMGSVPGASGGLALAQFSTEELLGPVGLPLGTAAAGGRALPARAAAATVDGSFDNPACLVETPTSVQLTNCSITLTSTNLREVITASGSMSVDPTTRTLAWDLSIGIALEVSGAEPLSVSASNHVAGQLTVTATTVRGSMQSELSGSVSAQGQRVVMGVDESVDLDLTYADAAACASRVTGGTVEARRVWTARPQGANLPDAAAKVTWTGCGAATIQLGTR